MIPGERWLPWFRRQPPVHSPLTITSIARAATAALGMLDPRALLASQLGRRYDAARVTLVGSGTQALHLALRRALEESGGDLVGLPAYACPDVAAAAVGAGAMIELYDINPETLGPDPASLAGAVARGAAVVVVAPLYGLAPPWGDLIRLTKGAGATLVEDAAQGFGGALDGKPLGTLGTRSVLSFGRGKGWTGGHGGALLERGGVAPASVSVPSGSFGEEFAVAASAAAQWIATKPSIYALPAAMPWLQLGETRYRDPIEPHAISRSAAALLDATLSVAEREAKERRRRGEWMQSALAGFRGTELFRGPAGGTSGWLRFPVRVRRGMAGLSDPGAARALGVSPGYPLTLGELPQVRQRLVSASRWPGAARLVRDLVTLPTHSQLTEREMRRVLALLPR